MKEHLTIQDIARLAGVSKATKILQGVAVYIENTSYEIVLSSISFERNHSAVLDRMLFLRIVSSPVCDKYCREGSVQCSPTSFDWPVVAAPIPVLRTDSHECVPSLRCKMLNQVSI